jgi:hypothetical protein
VAVVSHPDLVHRHDILAPIRLKNPNARHFRELGGNATHILFPGLTAGGANLHPQSDGQDVVSVRDDFAYSFSKGGRHTLKLGTEWLHQNRYDIR